MLRLPLVVCILICSACTTIKLNHDNTNTITYRGGPEVGLDLATRACRRAGERRAIIISTINKDASLPDGTGRQMTTFRCTSGEGESVAP